MPRSAALFAFLLATCLLSLSENASAEAYSYVDSDGQLHFVDSLHSVPEQYRAEATDIESDPQSTGGVLAASLKDHRLALTKVVEQTISNTRRAKGKAPLSHAQKRELSGFFRTWLPILLLSHAVMLIVCVIVVIHGFLEGHALWALANLLFSALVAPFYCALHVGNENKFLKVLASALALGPPVVLAKGAFDLSLLFTRLSG
jgi:hypothetical protein